MLVPAPTKSSRYVYFHIKPFKDNDRDIQHWEKVIENLISLKDKVISFVVSGNAYGISFFVKLPVSFKHYFENTFYSNYPTSDLVEISAPKLSKERHWIIPKKGETFREREEFSKGGTYIDPMNDVLALFQNIDRKSRLDLFFDYTFKTGSAFKQAMELLGKFIKWARASSDKKPGDDDDTKKKETKKKQIYFSLSYAITTEDTYSKEGIEKNLISVFAPFVSNGKLKVKRMQKRNHCAFSEVINMFHIPVKENFVKGLEYTLYRKLPFPTNIPNIETFPDLKKLTLLGDTDYRGDKVRFGIKEEDKFRHIYIVGKTGTGKSTFISNMIISDMQAGNGVCVLDPHGELVDTIIESIPSHRINDVILFDISDTEYPIGFNLLQADNEDEKNRIASGVVSTFQKLFDNSRGPRLEYILRNVVLSIIDYPNATLMHILRVLTDKEFREEVISHVKDSVLLKFRNNEFNKWQDKQREEAVGPITNKVGQFLSSRLVRNVFGQPRTRLSMRKAMDEGKIILVNLSKGKIGEDNANMIGSLLVTKIQIDAMARAEIAAHLRRPFYLYIDEFQNFATKSFATILSEARKYKLSLILANQYTSQLDIDIKNAIFGNVGTIVSFTLGYDDAAIMTSQFKELVGTNDLISLPKYTSYTRLMIDGISSDPFSMKTLPPYASEGNVEYIEKIRRQSRQRYAMERTQLESLLNARNKKTFSLQEKVAEKSKLEGLGLSAEDASVLGDFNVQQNVHRFADFLIDGQQADAMVMDIDHQNFKYVRYTKPEQLEKEATVQYRVGDEVVVEEDKKLPFAVESYQHNEQKLGVDPLIIRVGDKDAVHQQLTNMYQILGFVDGDESPLKFVINVEKMQRSASASPSSHSSTTSPSFSSSSQQKKKADFSSSSSSSSSHTSTVSASSASPTAGSFTVNDIKLGQSYEGYVKLMYNYGIFVTVKGVEGLLHKNWIAPLGEGIDWKKYYNIGDKINVQAKEFKDIDGEKRVVWSQL
ncbi:MAG: type IV secretion system DNA-binding domain-containing protein [Candidatus Peribacteria bacterium]|jgi:hypothetical protein|nr:type IV secretion system DNA-binding domain-containing protein [Candidatus Peribacteria bacterium]